MPSLWERWLAYERKMGQFEVAQKKMVIDFIEKHRRHFHPIRVTWSFGVSGPPGFPELTLMRVGKDIGFTDGQFFKIGTCAPNQMPHAVFLYDNEVRELLHDSRFISELSPPRQGIFFFP